MYLTNIFLTDTINLMIDEKDLKNPTGNSKIFLVIVVLFIILGVGFYFFTQSSVITEDQGKSLPETDTVGTKDLDVIGRYPESIRINYENPSDRGYEAVTYITKDTIEKVKQHYVINLQEERWQIASNISDQMKFERNPETLFLTFYTDEANQILKYVLEYYPESKY